MKTKLTHQHSGFTLIEMLVVIGIILLLAGMAFPVIGRAKQAVKKKSAKAEIAHLVTAISQFNLEYRRMPGSKMAFNSLVPDSCPDFTFGTVRSDGTPLHPTAITSTGNNATYQNCNAELMSILCNQNTAPNTDYSLNPRRIPFFHPRQAISTNVPGLGPDGVLRDPWGNPYIITLDMNADNKCQDGFYYPLTKPTKAFFIPDVVGIWSFGPDGQVSTVKAPPAGADRSTWNAAKYKENKDNVVSWE